MIHIDLAYILSKMEEVILKLVNSERKTDLVTPMT